MYEINETFRNNPIIWGKYYLSHHLRSKSPSFHMKIMDTVLNNRFVAIQAPRESAKSTIAAFLYIIHCIVFKKKRHIVILQNTYKKAKESLNTIKSEFKDNDLLINDYGIKILRDAEGDSIIIHPDGFKTRIYCAGNEQMGAIRGEKFGAYRPDLILVDDLEDDTMVLNPERRKSLMNLFDDAVAPAKDIENGQIVVIGTILHDDCLMAKFVSPDYYKEYKKLFYIALYYNEKTGKNESLWKEKWSVDYLIELSKIKPSKFAKEYQGDPVSGRLKSFDESDFRYWKIINNNYVLYDKENNIVSKGSLSECSSAIGCDLAWDEKKTDDFTAIIPVFITPNSDLLIDEYFCKKGVKPNEFEEVLFAMENRLSCITGRGVTIGFEKGKLEKVMKWFLKQAMRKRNRFLTIKDLPWVHDKIARIITPLQPRYKMNTIYHTRNMGQLENQLLRIPSGTHDDLPDALQMAVRLLEYAPSRRKSIAYEEYDEGFEKLRNSILKRSLMKKTGKRFIFGQKKSNRFKINCINSLN